MSDDNRASCGCPTYWVEDKGKPYGDCPYCEIDRLRDKQAAEIEALKEAFSDLSQRVYWLEIKGKACR